MCLLAKEGYKYPRRELMFEKEDFTSLLLILSIPLSLTPPSTTNVSSFLPTLFPGFLTKHHSLSVERY
jgi:hypothetical protein